MEILVLKGIVKSFIQRGRVLDNLSLEIGKGDAIAIMGPSGSGKTTLLNIIGLLDRPDSGTVTFEGSDILRYSDNDSAAYRNRNIGFVFQEHLLLPHLTVRDNILLPLLAGGLSRAELKEKEEYVSNLMEMTGITSLSGKYPSFISGGEAQRAALVRALANQPSVLLADEPTGSLDSGNAEILGNLLAGMNRDLGTTIILATHSEKLAGKMNRTLMITDGKLSK